MMPFEREQAIVGMDHVEVAEAQHVATVPEREQAARQCQRRGWLGLLPVDRERRMCCTDRQPGPGLRKAE